MLAMHHENESNTAAVSTKWWFINCRLEDEGEGDCPKDKVEMSTGECERHLRPAVSCSLSHNKTSESEKSSMTSAK